MDTAGIWKLIWISALPVSTIYGFLFLVSIKFVCRILQIYLSKPYVFVEPRIRLLSSLAEGLCAALAINAIGMVAQIILTPPVVGQQWLWSISLTWVLWFMGIFAGRSIAVWVFGGNICGHEAKR